MPMQQNIRIGLTLETVTAYPIKVMRNTIQMSIIPQIKLYRMEILILFISNQVGEYSQVELQPLIVMNIELLYALAGLIQMVTAKLIFLITWVWVATLLTIILCYRIVMVCGQKNMVNNLRKTLQYQIQAV
ncbi:hypothetical protein BK147_04815 [Paenibacillus sp. FSL R7-0337]|nr:hypothetical protein BK147_04815 [Paenibacillus sp. FSL R7-0337]